MSVAASPGRLLLFVYGTLKRGGSNHHALAGQIYVGDARTPPGYRLYLVADYPGMVADASDRTGVSGEVWEVDAPALRRLDALEGVDEHLYRRDTIRLLAPFADETVQTYFYLRSIRGRRPFPDGTWPVRFPQA